MFAKSNIILSLNDEQVPTVTVWDDWSQGWKDVTPDKLVSDRVSMQFSADKVTITSFSSRIAQRKDDRYNFFPAAVIGMTEQGYHVVDANGNHDYLSYNYVYKVVGKETLVYTRDGAFKRRLPYVIVNCTNDASMFPMFIINLCTKEASVTLPLGESLKRIYERRAEQWRIYSVIGNPGTVNMQGMYSVLQFGYTPGWERSTVIPSVSMIKATHKPLGVPINARATLEQLNCITPVIFGAHCFNTTESLNKLNVIAPCVFESGVFEEDTAFLELQSVNLKVYSCNERLFAELLALPSIQTINLEILDAKKVEKICCPDAQVIGKQALSIHGLQCARDLSDIKVKLSGDITDRIRGYFAECKILN